MDISQTLSYLGAAGRIVLPVIAVILVLRCTISLIRNRPRNKPMGILVNAINGDKIFLDKWETSIGRSKSCDITLAYGTVSRFHAVISRRRNGWTVTDTGSHSGTFVNAQRINGKTYLNDGDAIARLVHAQTYDQLMGFHQKNPNCLLHSPMSTQSSTKWK